MVQSCGGDLRNGIYCKIDPLPITVNQGESILWLVQTTNPSWNAGCLFYDGLASLTHPIFVNIQSLSSEIAVGTSQIILYERKRRHLEPSIEVSPFYGWFKPPTRHGMDASFMTDWPLRLTLSSSIFNPCCPKLQWGHHK